MSHYHDTPPPAPIGAMRLVAVILLATVLSGCATIESLTNGQASDGTDGDVPRALYLDVIRELQEEGRWNASLAYLDAYENVRQDDPQAMILRADALSEVGDTEEARIIYQRLLDSDVSAAAHAGLGHIAAGQGDWGGAVGHFTAAAEARPTDARYLNNLGYALLNTGAYERALRTLARAYELEPTASNIRNNLAIAYFLSGRQGQYQTLLSNIASEAEREEVRRLAESWAGDA